MPPQPPSHTYYFDVGSGSWAGTFTFAVTSWRELGRAGVGVKNLLLVAAMSLTQRIAGPSELTSVVVPQPEQGELGVVDNTVRLASFMVTLYDLHERYVLDADGVGVHVIAKERFGPVPGMLTRRFEYPAQIDPDGLGSTYHMPLLGSPWTATYQVGADRASLAGTLTCSWAEADEQATKRSS